jgi:hypothetical protein
VSGNTWQDPYRAVSYLKAAMAPGSYLVLSHGTGDSLDPGAADGLRRVYAGTTDSAALPWPPGRALFLGGVGKKL